MMQILSALVELTMVFLEGLLLPRRKPAADLKRQICHLSLSQIDVDIRIAKYVISCVEAGIPTVVVGSDPDPKSMETRRFEKDGAQFVIVPTPAKRLFLYWRAKHAEAAMATRSSVYHAHDLTSLLVALIAARRTGGRAIFDAHEIWSANVEYDPSLGKYRSYSALKKFCLNAFEGLLSHRVDLFVTVNEPIAQYYKKRFALPRAPLVVRNVPNIRSFPVYEEIPLKANLGLKPEDFLLGYIGGLGPSRNIESVINALKHVREANVHFLIMGPGMNRFRDEYRALAAEAGVSARVHLLDGVKMNEVFNYMRSLDAGIVMLENLCLNFYYFLPNKVFEYMWAEIPTLSSDFPVISSMIKGERVGDVFNPHDPKSIAAEIDRMASLPVAERLAMGERGKRAIATRLNWDQEVQPYFSALEQLLAEVGLPQ